MGRFQRSGVIVAPHVIRLTSHFLNFNFSQLWMVVYIFEFSWQSIKAMRFNSTFLQTFWSSLVYISRGHRLQVPNIFLSPRIYFVFTNSTDPDKMLLWCAYIFVNRAWSWSKLFDTKCSWKNISKKLNFEKNQLKTKKIHEIRYVTYLDYVYFQH